MSDLIVLPAGIDIHVHFREPGLIYKENMSTGMHAALRGGINTVIDMPNTIPVTDTLDSYKNKLKLASEFDGLHLAAGMTNHNVENGELEGLMDYASVFKVFIANSTGNLAIDTKNLFKGIEILERGNILLMFHAEKPQHIKQRTVNSVENEVRPEIAEIDAIKQVIDMAKEFPNVNMHVTHVSTFNGAQLLLDQSTVTWDVLPKYLDFSSDIVSTRGNYAKMNPPLRTRKDMIGLNQLLEEGKIPMIASDHAPHTREDKKSLTAGAPGVQELYHTMIDRYIDDRISMKILNDVIHNKPRELLYKVGIKPEKGEITVDIDSETKVDDKFIQSRCGWSLWQGKIFKGKIVEYNY